MDRTNARYLRPEVFPVVPARATIDVSFISLEKVLPAVFAVLTAGAEAGGEPGGEVIALVKPQFEVGRGAVGKGGVVRDPDQHRSVVTRLARFAVLHRWHVRDVTASPLRGPKGNREFFLHLTAGGRTATDLEVRVARLTEEAET
jgi:23S rRNA (cytidine1920-2'-O)/16S rRNA (cytidine1409-2'-O)-methyltransferase